MNTNNIILAAFVTNYNIAGKLFSILKTYAKKKTPRYEYLRVLQLLIKSRTMIT